MQKKLLWKIGGEAGFGIMTTGELIAKNATRRGYHIYEYAEYPSLIRGGHNTDEVVISDEPVHSTKWLIDILICLNKETFDLHKKRLHSKSLVVYEKNDFEIEEGDYILLDLPFKGIIREETAFFIMINNIAIGASLALLGWDMSIVDQIIEQSFEKKGQEVIDENKRVAHRGFEYIKEKYAHYICTDFPLREVAEKAVMTGNDAFSLGAIAADCRLYCAYPMTPASSVLEILAGFQEKTGMVVRHAEDEISVINTALGGSHAGVRAAVGSSGGGFALMVESISYAGVAEIPIVIFLSQRPGPATGMPTWTEQGDLQFAIHAGHGEFPKIVLAPGTIEEMFDLTLKAFNLADIYQTPVIVMSDKLLSEGHESVLTETMNQSIHNHGIDRGSLLEHVEGEYHRYEITEDGISPRLIPGQKGVFYQSNSYEHSPSGHTTEAAGETKAQTDKRNQKRKTYLKTHFKPPQVIGDLESAEIVLVSWGSTKGAILEAMKELTDHKLAFLHFTHVYPLDASIKEYFEPDKTYVIVENNSYNQLGRVLREEVNINIAHSLLKYDGRPIFYEEIVELVRAI